MIKLQLSISGMKLIKQRLQGDELSNVELLGGFYQL